jgi:hypothetical protein
MFSALLSFVLLFSTPAIPGDGSLLNFNSQSPEEIPIKENGNFGGNPRQQVDIPIRAAYFGGTVFVSFLQNLGDVEITIEEQSNGIILQTIVDSSTLSVALPLNMTAGDFCISFLLESGAEYSGQFSL